MASASVQRTRQQYRIRHQQGSIYAAPEMARVDAAVDLPARQCCDYGGRQRDNVAIAYSRRPEEGEPVAATRGAGIAGAVAWLVPFIDFATIERVALAARNLAEKNSGCAAWFHSMPETMRE